MPKTQATIAREQRLAAKLRENLKRRKGQARARAEAGEEAPVDRKEKPTGKTS